MLLICLTAVLPQLVFAESDVPGWGKAKWGMPFSEVTKLYGLNNWEAGARWKFAASIIVLLQNIGEV